MMSTYSTTPSLILTGTLVVLTTALAMAGGGFQASAVGARANIAARIAAGRAAQSVSLPSIRRLNGPEAQNLWLGGRFLVLTRGQGLIEFHNLCRHLFLG